MKIKTALIASIALIGIITSTQAEEYRNIDGKVLTEQLTENCNNALDNYIKSKQKTKMYLEADDDSMILHSAKVTLRWAIEAKAECSKTIPAKWEQELDEKISKLSLLLKNYQ